MAQKISEIMTANPMTVDTGTPLTDVAQTMREHDVGDVLVTDHGGLCGVVTDRDIVVRGLATGNPANTPVGDICSRNLVSVTPDDHADEAVRLMRENALRRLPVLRNGELVGIVSIGDLAVERDEKSALADISTAPPNT